HVDERFHRNEYSCKCDRQVHSGKHYDGGKCCTAADACDAEGGNDCHGNQRDDICGVDLNADGRCYHDAEHCRVDSCTAVLSDGDSETSGDVGDAGWYSETDSLCLYVQGQRTCTGTGSECE